MAACRVVHAQAAFWTSPLVARAHVNALESSAGRDIVLSGAAAAIVGGVSLLGGRGRLAQAVRAAPMPSSQSVDDAEQKSVSPLALGVDVVPKNSLLVHAVLHQHRD